MATPEPITAELIDETAGKVTVPGVGEVIVMSFYDEDTGKSGLRIMVDAPEGTPTTVGPA